jgi:uncharacterized protein
MKTAGARAVVTGASSGIGKATALALARRGAHLALAARSADALERTADACRELGVSAVAIPTDVSDREACERLAREAAEAIGPIDIVVNNAGFAIFDTIAEARAEDVEAMIRTNYLGAFYCTRAFLPSMIERRSGSIVNVGSIAGLMGYERMGAYCASKFAMTGFTEALRNETKRFGIEVSLVCPGTTDTPFFEIAERGRMPGASRLLLAISPERVAGSIVRAIESGGRYRRIVPFTASVYIRFKELFPRSAHAMMRGVSRVIEGRRSR